MQITTTEQDGFTVLHLTGRMDATTVNLFEETCRAKLDAGCIQIAISLEGIEYISSAGLRGILTMEKASRAVKGKLSFCCMQDMVAEVFKISGFTAILSVHTSLNEAVTALKS